MPDPGGHAAELVLLYRTEPSGRRDVRVMDVKTPRCVAATQAKKRRRMVKMSSDAAAAGERPPIVNVI